MMYTGNYYPKEDGLNVPRDYGGSTFVQSGNEPIGHTPEESGTTDAKEAMSRGPFGTTDAKEAMSRGPFGTLASHLPLGKILPEGLRGALHLDKFKIGTEEMLIIALALFLFLSKEGDKECAIILFLLLFVN